MRYLYQVKGHNALFETRQAAEEAVRETPKDWARALGGWNKDIERVPVFSSADEWARYSGMRLRRQL